MTRRCRSLTYFQGAVSICLLLATQSFADLDADTERALADGDECPADDSTCALSLRQLRARAEGAESMSPERVSVKANVGAGVQEVAPPDTAPASAPKTGPPFTDPSLFQPSDGKLFTFYMYRAISDENYPPLNVNSANLPGVLWYLHHEVVVQAPRKFNIQSIARYKVQMKATAPLLRQRMNYGVRFAFDKGQATGPFVCGRNKTNEGFPEPAVCQGEFQASYLSDLAPYKGPFEWSKYGYFVGCNTLGYYPFPTYKVDYVGGVWYSLPGPCPSKPFDQHDDACKKSDPGGFCGLGVTPTGAGDCTWTYELAGNISIDELVGLKDQNGYYQFVQSGGKEYDPYTDHGTDFHWWDGYNSEAANSERVRQAGALFDAKYPTMPKTKEMDNPPCDFQYKRFFMEFYLRDPNYGPCEYPRGDSECAQAIQYAKKDGIFAHPEWYIGLGPGSSPTEFQRILFQQGMANCKRPCNPGEKPS